MAMPLQWPWPCNGHGNNHGHALGNFSAHCLGGLLYSIQSSQWPWPRPGHVVLVAYDDEDGNDDGYGDGPYPFWLKIHLKFGLLSCTTDGLAIELTTFAVGLVTSDCLQGQAE